MKQRIHISASMFGLLKKKGQTAEVELKKMEAVVSGCLLVAAVSDLIDELTHIASMCEDEDHIDDIIDAFQAQAGTIDTLLLDIQAAKEDAS